MTNPLQTLMREATRLTQAGRLDEATQALQRALGGMVGTPFSPGATKASPHGYGTTATTTPTVDALLLDGTVYPTSDRPADPCRAPAPQDVDIDVGTFTAASYSHAGLTRRYKLYIPPRAAGRPMVLVVMLHGCTQNPDDFAAGTNMNALAREHGFLVLYPEQSRDANPSRCWNWFKHNHQRRGSGEPALIASLTQMVVREHGLDPRRVYIAGLSAGGAMATIVATAYPEVFVAAGVHSGLPGGIANNVPEALMLMKSGGASRAGLAAKPATPRSVPTIVFHGGDDQTVHPRNGEQVVAAVLAGQPSGVGAMPNPSAPNRVEDGLSPAGRRYTRSIYNDGNGAPIVEHWLVHGAGHAWAGGMPSGSYTDPTGPDATREMLRFFFSQPSGKTH